MSFLLPVRWTAVAAGPPPTPIEITPPQGDLVISTTAPYAYWQNVFNIVNCFLWTQDVEFQSVPNLIAIDETSTYNDLRVNILNTDLSGGDAAITFPTTGEQTPVFDVDGVNWCNPLNPGGRQWTIRGNPTYIRNNKTLNVAVCTPTTWVPAGVPPSGYDVPTENTLHVGTGQTYSTIWAAYGDAVDGDNIIIHPEGSPHSANEFIHASGNPAIQKSVSFWGSTGDPNDVIITSGSGTNGIWFEWQLGSRAESGKWHIPGIYHLTIRKTFASTGSTLLRITNT